MSPEQAKGRAVDKRADIWAFGVVLHEMLTGRRLFDAEDMSETLAAVLTRDVSMTTLPAAIPARLRALLRDCLIRDPRQRLRDIGDARIALEQIIAGAPDDVATPALVTAAVVPAWRRALPWAVAGGAVIAAGVLLLWSPWRAEKPVDRPLARLDVDLGADVSLPPLIPGENSIAISPDGTRLAYASGNPSKLFTRRLDQSKAVELPGTQGARSPFFSPDGQWVGFSARGKVNKISVEGGSVVPLGDNSAFAGASWSEDGSIFVSEAIARGLLRFPAGGGPPESVLALGAGVVAFAHPQILPGGKAILFATGSPRDLDKPTIEVLTLADRHRKIVARGGNSPRYLATSSGSGHLVYVDKATLFAIPFDLDTLKTRGTAVPVMDDVAYQGVTGSGQFDVSRTGTLVYRRGGGDASAMRAVQWLDPAGRKEPLRAQPGLYANPSLSPDGTRVALAVADGGGQDIWVYDQRRDAMTRLTFGGTLYFFSAWSPDGRHVVFSALGNGIFQARADGAGQPQALTLSKAGQIPGSFTPDGKRLAYAEGTGNNLQIWTVPLEDQGGQLKAGKPEPFLTSHRPAPVVLARRAMAGVSIERVGTG
jgi:serine/threonine-protein kinase